MKLLTQNIKLKKNPKYNTWGLDLAPANTSGYNTCKFAGVCKEVCVGLHSGFNQMDSARQGKIRKTQHFFRNKDKFLAELHNDLKNLNNSKDPRKTLVRLNVDSDIPWETIDSSLFDYKNITYYDYTKYFSRAWAYTKGQMPTNYHLTYSWNENSNKTEVNRLLKNGGCINMVLGIRYKSGSLLPIPSYVQINTMRHPTVDGDVTDERFPENDGTGKVVIVRAKTKKSEIENYIKKNFFVRYDGRPVKL